MKKLLLASTLAAGLVSPTSLIADPAFGFGITVFSNGDAAVGLRVFSDNRRYKPAASLGFDYKFETNSFRPAIGVAYLDRNAFVDATLGFDLSTSNWDLGLGVGKLWNSQPAAAPIAPTPPPPTPTPTPTPSPGTDS